MIYWFTGNTGAGKTTIGRRVAAQLGAIQLDGDELRKVWPGLGLSMEDRLEQNLRVARLALLLSNQGHVVVVSVIAPTHVIRGAVEAICRPSWIHVDGPTPSTPERPYEAPEAPWLRVEPDAEDGRLAAQAVLQAARPGMGALMAAKEAP